METINFTELMNKEDVLRWINNVMHDPELADVVTIMCDKLPLKGFEDEFLLKNQLFTLLPDWATKAIERDLMVLKTCDFMRLRQFNPSLN